MELIEPEILDAMNIMFGELQRAVAELQELVPTRSQPYSGPLTSEQVVAGIRNALRNSRELLSDAELLFAHGRYPRAAALAVLSLEECWKALLVGAYPFLVDDSNRKALKYFWNRHYRYHVSKSGVPETLGLLSQTFGWDDIQGSGNNLGRLMDSIKQASFYADYTKREGKVRATSPSGEVQEGLASAAQELANRSLVLVEGIAEMFIAITQQTPNAMLGENPTDVVQRLSNYYPGIASALDILADIANQAENTDT